MSPSAADLVEAVDWLQAVGPRRAGRYFAYEGWHSVLRQATRPNEDGTVIYERDWDLLVVLDACRADLLAEVVDEYPFLSLGSVQSVASASHEWMQETFTDEYAEKVADTAYVTGNPWTDDHCDPTAFERLDEVWRYGWDDELGTIPPAAVTDRAVAVAREHDPGRLVVHYMQPHFPFVPDPVAQGMDLDRFGEGHEMSVWEHLRAGEVDRERAWEGYRENLRYVLDDVETLLRNVDAETAVITADHGNGLGEYGVYGHPPGVAIPALRRVPWVETTACDTGEYEPDERLSSRVDDGDDGVEDRLRDLGYR